MGTKSSGATHTIALRSDCDEIIKDVILGKRTKKEIAALCGIHESNVTRYFKKHVTEEMRREIIAEDRMTRMERATGVLNSERIEIADSYNSLARRVEALISKAETSEDDAFALSAMEGLRRVLKDIATMSGQMANDLTIQVTLAESKEWVTLRNILSKVIAEVPAAREPLLRHMRHEALSITKEDRDVGL
ncbi:MAG: hypothetical protein N4A61_11230 [Pelagimonas sp.]|jgi:AcrR family transcriptional regulator|nr:hypothetical protein [Pelagimonas sp.]